MKRVSFDHLHIWQFENLSQQKSIRHFVTERLPVKQGNEFTLSYSSSPDRNEIENNRNALASAMGVAPSKLFFPSQVHLTRIVNITSQTPKSELMETDALITSEPGVCIAVMSADCVPILVYDKKNHVAGAIHSGWKGTVARILEKTLHHMNEVFGTRGEDVVAGIGPSVSQQSYEVGEEVVAAVHQSFRNSATLLQHLPNNKAKLDLWRANEFQLAEFGVKKENIEVSDLCTVLNNTHFFSARKGDRGRFAAGIMLL